MPKNYILQNHGEARTYYYEKKISFDVIVMYERIDRQSTVIAIDRRELHKSPNITVNTLSFYAHKDVMDAHLQESMNNLYPYEKYVFRVVSDQYLYQRKTMRSLEDILMRLENEVSI